MVNGVLDPLQSRSYAQSITSLAAQLHLPRLLVDVRHEATHQTLPDARVVYVDSDPVTVAFARGLLRGEPRTCAVEADLRRPEQVLRNPGVMSHLDLREPYAVLMVDVLRYVDDATGPGRVVRRYRHALPAGGFLVVSHPAPVEQLMEGLLIEAPIVVPGAYASIGRKGRI